ncbi:MAG: hypothetical protein ACRETG_03620, partial [Steroidobacteraceae bacterium]
AWEPRGSARGLAGSRTRGLRLALRVIGREDFIAMKTFAGDPKDLADARSAIRVAGDALDLTT